MFILTLFVGIFMYSINFQETFDISRGSFIQVVRLKRDLRVDSDGPLTAPVLREIKQKLDPILDLEESTKDSTKKLTRTER